jgi:Flp pilus assembly protein TadB
MFAVRSLCCVCLFRYVQVVFSAWGPVYRAAVLNMGWRQRETKRERERERERDKERDASTSARVQRGPLSGWMLGARRMDESCAERQAMELWLGPCAEPRGEEIGGGR